MTGKMNIMPTQGSVALTTFITDMPATLAVTNSFNPTGGVIMGLRYPFFGQNVFHDKRIGDDERQHKGRLAGFENGPVRIGG